MTTTLYATFDGEVLRPDRPVPLPPNTRVRLIIETTEPEPSEITSFLQTAQALNLDGPADWSTRLEEYLYGEATKGGD
jgi:hypothetical protein